MGANRHLHKGIWTLKSNEVLVHARLVGGGDGVTLTVDEPFEFGSAVSSVTRAGEGDYDIVFRDTFPQVVGVCTPAVISGTTDRAVQWTALDVSAGTASILATTAGVAADLLTTESVFLVLIVRNTGGEG